MAKLRVGSSKAKTRKFETQFPPRQRFDKTKLGLYANAWDQLPHVVCWGGQKNFAEFLKRVMNQETDPIRTEADFKRLIAKIILFRDVEKAIREVKEILGYRSQLAAYLVALISSGTEKQFDLDRIWKTLKWYPRTCMLTSSNMRSPCRIASSELSMGRNVTEWCKKVDCWKKVEVSFKMAFALRK